MKYDVSLKVNGVQHTLAVRDNETLLETLRDRLELHGARKGCGVSVCGACTVLINGDPVSSCMQLTRLVDGQSVETIEGLARGEELHPLQQAFWQRPAMQCSYCTPGFILAAKSILKQEPEIAEDRLHFLLSGNLCRCTGYTKIKEALREAQAAMKAR